MTQPNGAGRPSERSSASRRSLSSPRDSTYLRKGSSPFETEIFSNTLVDETHSPTHDCEGVDSTMDRMQSATRPGPTQQEAELLDVLKTRFGPEAAPAAPGRARSPGVVVRMFTQIPLRGAATMLTPGAPSARLRPNDRDVSTGFSSDHCMRASFGEDRYESCLVRAKMPSPPENASPERREI